MRRLKILYYWLFNSRNNVSFLELMGFLLKPTVRKVAERYIESIKLGDDSYEVKLRDMKRPLYWPLNFPVNGVYQVAAETFDKKDWHYYQKEHTEISPGEVVVDIGTAEGLFILKVIDKCKKVILIEPNPSFVKALERSFVNDQNKVAIHNVAIGAERKEIYFNSASLASKVELEEGNNMKINMETIDHLLANEPVVTYLKADIEGFELEMLKGAEQIIRKHRPKIALTTYHIENNASEIISLIMGYVPDYKYFVKGVFQDGGKPVMVHFW